MKKMTLLAAAALALLAVSCGGKAQSGEKHLIVAVNPDFKTFDPALAYEPFAEWVLAACYHGLMEYDGSIDRLVPGAAQGFDVSEDGKTYTFTMRQNVVFAGGNVMTSRDVKWSHERLIELKGSGSSLAGNIGSIEAPDDQTVIYHLKTGDPAFPYKLTSGVFNILDSRTAESHGAASGPGAKDRDTAKLWLDGHSAGSGPYQIESYTPDVTVIMVRNPDYTGPAVHFDRITLRVVQDPNTQAMMLQRGDVDIAFDIGPEQAKQLEGKSGITIMGARSLTASFLLMNRDRAVGGPVADPRVQKAIRLALDYPGIQTVAGPRMVTPRTPFPIGLAGSLGAADVTDYPRTGEARVLMAQAGWSGGFSVKFHVPALIVAGVDLMLLAQKVQADLQTIGINAEIQPEPVGISLNSYRDGQQPLGLWYWKPDYFENTSQIAFLPGNFVGLRAKWTAAMNPALARLGDQASQEINDARRNALYTQIQTALIDDTAFAMLLQHSSQYAVRTGLMNADYNMQRLNFRRIGE